MRSEAKTNRTLTRFIYRRGASLASYEWVEIAIFLNPISERFLGINTLKDIS